MFPYSEWVLGAFNNYIQENRFLRQDLLNKEFHLILSKWKIHQENIAIINVDTLKIVAPNFIKLILPYIKFDIGPDIKNDEGF